MKASSVSLSLGLTVLLFGLTVSAVFLNVSPNRQLFFRRDSVSLSCVEDRQTVDGWTVKRTTGGQTQMCGQQDFGMIDGSSCIVSQLFPSDSGVYWCETRAGQRSAQVTISVSGHSVILEFPELPVIIGSNVTLRCKTRDGSKQTSYFFRNDTFIGYESTGEFTIRDVQQSHEGLYSCSTGLFSKSSKSWLSVRDPPPPPPPPRLFVARLLCPLVVIFLYCISTALMVSIYCKRTGNKPGVSMEMDPRVEGGRGPSEDYVTEHDF